MLGIFTRRHVAVLTASAALSLAAFTYSYAADMIPAGVAKAVADAGRPDADKARDADRKPAEIIAFAGIKEGDKVLDLVPGGGYFTRIFSKTVGPKGKVYALVPSELVTMRATAADAVKAIAADAAYANVSVVSTPFNAIAVSEPLDVVWTSLNYHDFHVKALGADAAAVNRAAFSALKKGGTYIVIDHAAAKGSGLRDPELLHRIDAEQVKTEVLAAGFELVGESNLLAHPADDHTAKVFDAGVRGKTDQFALKFRKK